MKNKEKAYSIALASTFIILFLILVSSTASASIEEDPNNINPPEITGGAVDPFDGNVLSDDISTEGNYVAGYTINETRITTNKSNSEKPAIYNNKIVWQDNRNGNWDIYIQDLSTKSQIHTTNLSDQVNPDIYGNNVVWEDYRNELSDIYLQNLTTKKQTRITTNDDDFPMEDYLPSIYGNKIAYNSHGPCDCYWIGIYDISTKKFSEIGIVADGSPSIYGNKLVCYDGYNMEHGIYLFDLSTLKGTMIVSNESYQGSPSIYGNRIVFPDNRNGNWDIYMYNLSTKKETRITTNASDSLNPDIYGNIIVWQDNRNGNWDIYTYDLVTRKQMHTANKYDQLDPAIYSKKIVWTDWRNGNEDIYMGTIS